MAGQTQAAAAARTPEPGGLAGGALGLWSVLFCVVTGAAPLTAMLFNVPVAVLGSGDGAPAAFLVATVALTVFSVGYIAMCRRVTSAGGFYTFVSRGLGPVPGVGAGLLLAACYVVFVATVIGALGYWSATTVASWTGVVAPAWVYSGLGLATMSVLAWFRIELTARVLGVVLTAEVTVMVVLAVAVLARGGADGLPLAPLNPVEVFGNAEAVRVFGAAGAGVALFAAFWSWTGFEVAPNYAEEARDPARATAVATYGSVIGLGLFYVLVSYAFVVGWGPGTVAQAVSDQFGGAVASAFYPLSDRYVGAPLTVVIQLLVVTGNFACGLAFYNTAARYLFALGRERVLPAALARTSRRGGPVVAAMTVTAVVALYCLAFTLYDPSTEAALLKLATWSPLLGVLGILAVQALVCVAIIRFFRTEARDGFRWLSTLVAPVLGALSMVAACWLLVANRSTFAGAQGVLFVELVPWTVAAVFLAGTVTAVVMRSRHPDRYARIGHPAPTPSAD